MTMSHNLPDPCNLSELLNNYEVIIPILQRDYAQGRTDKRTVDIRNRFLNTLKEKAHSDSGITLDFVYGEINKEEGVFTPLDGQQRLTTLLLLHWYAAKRNLFDIEKDILKKFTYRTHPSARLFYKNLVEHTAELTIEKGKEISVQIQNHTSWWITKWKDDPTIFGMLTMLDAIHEVFADDTDHLNLDKINFHLINISTYGLTDDIYIKMNSRSLPLTPFERIKGAITDGASDISMKFDREWTNMLWEMLPEHNENSGQTLDNYFLNYIRYVCDTYLLTCGKKSARILNDYGMIDAALNPGENAPEKDFRTYLEDRFDMWKLRENGIAQLFTDYLCTARRDDGDQLTVDGIFDTSNLFRACCEGYSDTNDSYETKIKFKNSQVIMLYAFETYLLQHEPDKIDKNEFLTRLRWVRNLVWNSDLSNKLPALLKETASIICFGLPEEVKAFNNEQLKQEKKKKKWCEDHKDDEWTQALYRLEDHVYLHGDIGFFEEWLPELKKQHIDAFFAVHECPHEDIGIALICDKEEIIFPQHNKGNDAWHGVYHDRSNVSRCMKRLLLEVAYNEGKTAQETLSDIREKFVGTHRKDWRYYFAKYTKIHAESTKGYYRYPGYGLTVMRLQRTSSAYWNAYLLAMYLDLIDDDMKIECALDPKGGPLTVKGYKIYNEESRLRVVDGDGGEWERKINQVDKIDNEDRVEVGIKLIKQLFEEKAPESIGLERIPTGLA